MEDTQAVRKSRSNGQRTRQRILGCAVSLWSERGALGVTVSAVAERAGTTRRTVYHHFPTHEALVEEAGRFIEDELIALARGELSKPSNPYRFVAGLAADNPELIRSTLQRLLNDNPRENANFDDAARFWAASPYLDERTPPEHAAAITMALWLAASLVVSLRSSPRERQQEADRFAASLERLLWQGILTNPDTPAN